MRIGQDEVRRQLPVVAGRTWRDHKIDFASSPSETVATPSRRPTTSIGNVGANCKAKHKSKEKGDHKKDNNASCEGMYGVQDHDP
jgi:hypothetical protein